MAATARPREIKKLKQGFPQQAGICLAVMAAIHILPKSPDNKTFRLIFTLAYFGAALMLLWLINKPRAAYMKRLYELQYADSGRSEEHTSELQSRPHLVCRLLLEKKKYT